MIDEHTRALRRGKIGSSDAPAIVGCHPYQNSADVWLRVTGRAGDRPAGPAAEVGTYVEHGILSWLEAKLSTTLSRDQFFAHPDGTRVANLDALALALDTPAIVEAKSGGFFGRPAYLDQYGEDGSADVPEHVLVQVHHQLLVADAQPDLPRIDLVLVPALLVGRGFVCFRVPRNETLCEVLAEEEARWWTDHVVGGVMPADVPPSLDVLKTLRREPVTVPIDGDLVTGWLQAKADAKAARESEDEWMRAVLAALGDAEAGTCALGTLTYREQTRKAYAVAESSFRVARWKEAR